MAILAIYVLLGKASRQKQTECLAQSADRKGSRGYHSGEHDIGTSDILRLDHVQDVIEALRIISRTRTDRVESGAPAFSHHGYGTTKASCFRAMHVSGRAVLWLMKVLLYN